MTLVSSALSQFLKVCRIQDQFQASQRSRAWLTFDVTTQSVRCISCCKVKRLGLHAEPGQHHESAFIDAKPCDQILLEATGQSFKNHIIIGGAILGVQTVDLGNAKFKSEI